MAQRIDNLVDTDDTKRFYLQVKSEKHTLMTVYHSISYIFFRVINLYRNLNI